MRAWLIRRPQLKKISLNRACLSLSVMVLPGIVFSYRIEVAMLAPLFGYSHISGMASDLPWDWGLVAFVLILDAATVACFVVLVKAWGSRRRPLPEAARGRVYISVVNCVLLLAMELAPRLQR